MLDQDLLFADLTTVTRLLRDGELSQRELLEAVLDRIKFCEPRLNAFISLNRAATDPAGGPLHGLPVSIKDLFLTLETPTTAGSRVFGKGIESGADAEIVKQLKRAGALIIGKNNLHEFAYGITNENEHFGPTRNPWDISRISGGSSGGSAAAVAAGMAYASIGSDTRGSIRIPSACCGISGLKPTYRRLSTRGLVPLSPSLDHVGPMARSVRDLELLFSLLAPGRGNPAEDSAPPASRLRLGICDYYFRNLHPETESAIKKAILVFEEAGHSIHHPVALAGLEEAFRASGQISSAEALSYHDPHLRRFPEGYGPSVRRRLESGYSVSALDYLNAMETRRRITREFQRIFDQIDCLLAAVVPGPPPLIGSGTVDTGTGQEDVLPAFVRLNAPQNMAGVPSLTIPCGFTGAGLPIGMQLIAAAHREALLFAVGSGYQARTDWHLRRPSVGGS
jgi:aspartyl-tRNA(Asn)/glutamyl-tRNA(Gln) amidotransferase subunit A